VVKGPGAIGNVSIVIKLAILPETARHPVPAVINQGIFPKTVRPKGKAGERDRDNESESREIRR
jgi:hypothetical protein